MGQSLVEHAPVQLLRHAQLFRRLGEFTGCDDALPLPDAHQHLIRHDLPIGHMHDGLQMRLDPILAQRGTQKVTLTEHLHHAAVGCRVGAHYLVLAQGLGAIQHHIHGAVNLLCSRPILRIAHQAETGGAVDFPRRQLAIMLGQRLVQLARHLETGLGIGFRQQNGEFVAAQTRHQIPLAHPVGETPRQFLQYQVARGMTIGIVDDLEVVEIHHDERELPVVARRAHDLVAQVVLEFAPVEQAGERIVAGQLLQPFVVLLYRLEQLVEIVRQMAQLVE